MVDVFLFFRFFFSRKLLMDFWSEFFWAHVFHGIEFVEILRNVFLKVAKMEKIKLNICKWMSNNLPF